MRHLVSGRKLGRTSSHRRALMCNMASSLFEHKKIETTEAKAKELRMFAEKLITKAKIAFAREKQGLLPAGQTIDIHNRRMVARDIRKKAVLQELFDSIAPVVESRNGGYTRIIKTGFRHGDGGKTAIIELVDWSAPQDGAVSANRRKRKPTVKPVAKTQVETAKPVVAEVVEPIEVINEPMVEEVVTETVATTEEVVAEVETPTVDENIVAEETPTTDEKKEEQA